MYGRNSKTNDENEKIVFRVSRSPGFLTKILKDHQDPQAPKPAWATVIPNFRIKIKEAEDASAEVFLPFLLSWPFRLTDGAVHLICSASYFVQGYKCFDDYS